MMYLLNFILPLPCRYPGQLNRLTSIVNSLNIGVSDSPVRGNMEIMRFNMSEMRLMARSPRQVEVKFSHTGVVFSVRI